MRKQFVIFYFVVQAILLLAHLFLYETWAHFWYPRDAEPPASVKWAIAILAFSFPLMTLLTFKTAHILARAAYTVSAVWTGFGSFAVGASIGCWLIAGAARLFDAPISLRVLAASFFAAAAFASVYGVINGAIPRVRMHRVTLENLPASWRGRTIAIVSDLHVGPLRGAGFSKRIVALLNRIAPEMVLIPGDFFDGTTINLIGLASPWSELRVAGGAYFAAGNHEQFRDDRPYFDALESAGIRVLRNENVVVDGLQIAGVSFRDTTHADHYREVLARMNIDPRRASILLAHSPSRLGIPEKAGISLQVSGHTHGGQFWPYTWITKRIFGPYVHGLHRFASMHVLTTFGVGTWGPPLRVATVPEIVLIELQ